MRSSLAPSLTLLLLACSGGDEGPPSLLTSLDEDEAVGVVLDPVVNLGTSVTVPVRSVNRFGAAVPGEPIAVTVEGPSAGSDTVPVAFNADGYGRVDLTSTGAEAVTLTAVDPTNADIQLGAESTVYAVSGALPGYATAWGSALDLPGLVAEEGEIAVPDEGANATGGMAVSVGGAIWYLPATPGALPRLAADLPFGIERLQGVEIDDDGILDLVAWGENQVVMLRGVAGGSYAWAGGYQARSGAVVGAMAADTDSDGYTDLVVATSQDSGGGVQVLLGDGSWGFAPMPPLDLYEEVWSVTAEDEGLDGEPDISVITAGLGTIERFSWRSADRTWVGAATAELADYEALEGANLLPLTDLNGDGLFDIIIEGSPASTPQRLVWYTLGDPVVVYPLGFSSYDSELADMTGDGLDDLLVSEEGRSTVITHDGAGFVEIRVGLPTERGPTAGGEFSGQDAHRDLMVATDAVLVQPGAEGPSGWDKERYAWRAFATALAGPMLSTDLNGDGVSDIVGFTTDGSDLVVGTWVLLPEGDGRLDFGGRLNLGSGVDAHGLVACDGRFYALSGSGDDSTLTAFTVVADGEDRVPNLVGQTASNGTELGCGTLASGDPGLVVSNTSGFWSTYRPFLGPEATGNVSQTGAVTVVDGDVLSCSATDCSLAQADLDGDGTVEIATGGATVSLDWGGETLSLGGAGVVAFADVDQDGAPDLTATDPETGRIWIWRNVGNGLAPALVLHTDRDLSESTAWFGDTTGDGIPEIIVSETDTEGRLRTALSAASSLRWALGTP